MKLKHSTKQLKILDLDIENRPYSYWYDGRTTDFPIAIAWSWVGSDVIRHKGIKWSDLETKVQLEQAWRAMLEPFVVSYNHADMVTGHYLRKHDLPILNGLCVRLGLPALQPKVAQDTKLDFCKVGGISLSQENLAYMARLDAQKMHMPVAAWEEAFLLSRDGFEEAKKRVKSDVLTHKELRLEYAPYLKEPKTWRP